MNYAWLFAGGVAAFGLVLHLMLGRSRPMLPPAGKGSSDPLLGVDAAFGRHAASLVLAAMALTYAHAARAPDADDAALTISLIGLLLAAFRAALGLHARLPRAGMAEWTPMAAAAALGLFGVQL